MKDLVLVTEERGIAITTSLKVADMFNKKHKDVLKSIRNLMAENCAVKNLFYESEYKSERGRIEPMYKMNRDGFMLIAMGFTGSDALEWKMKYIKAFNEMEQMLKDGTQLTEKQKLELQLFSKNKAEVAEAHKKLLELETKPLIETIENQKPLVEFANVVGANDTLISIGNFSKVVEDEVGIDIGQNKLFKWLRDNKYLYKRGSNNIPYQQYVNSGYFVLKESVKNGMVFNQTFITGKGQMYLIKKLKESANLS